MYKLLLCWRYLRTRYIALASIISVTLGVATMIVVNSVMEGFSSEMQNRIHGILSDVIFTSASLDGMPNAEWHMEQIRQVAGNQIEAMSATVVVPAMLYYEYGGQSIPQQVQLIGIDEKTQGSVSDFGKYLQHPANRKAMSFDLREDGYDVRDHQSGPNAPERKQMCQAGWGAGVKRPASSSSSSSCRSRTNWRRRPGAERSSADPFANEKTPENLFDPARQQHTGLVWGSLGRFPHAHRRGQVPHRSRRRREAGLSHRGPAAQNRQRQLHHRRLLREQDERI